MTPRILAIALTTAGLVTAAAAAQPVADSYARAQSMFGQAPEALLENIDGEWLPISLLAGGLDVPVDAGMLANLTERFCGSDRGGRIIESRAGGITITIPRPGGAPLAEWYDWLGEGRFLYTVDPQAYAASLGLTGEDNQPDARFAQTLAQLPRTAGLHRVGDDVLVLAPDRGPATFLVRCP